MNNIWNYFSTLIAPVRVRRDRLTEEELASLKEFTRSSYFPVVLRYLEHLATNYRGESLEELMRGKDFARDCLFKAKGVEKVMIFLSRLNKARTQQDFLKEQCEELIDERLDNET